MRQEKWYFFLSFGLSPQDCNIFKTSFHLECTAVWTGDEIVRKILTLSLRILSL